MMTNKKIEELSSILSEYMEKTNIAIKEIDTNLDKYLYATSTCIGKLNESYNKLIDDVNSNFIIIRNNLLFAMNELKSYKALLIEHEQRLKDIEDYISSEDYDDPFLKFKPRSER